MRYYIEDDKKVIKTSRGFIFMCLGGDNNVTESRWRNGKWYEVRARSWCHMNHQILEAPEAEIMDFCQRVYTGDPEYQVFKKGGKWVCYKDMPNYFRDGMRRAQSLEALLQANRGQSLEGTVVVYASKASCDRNSELHMFLHTTQELEDWLDEAKALYQRRIADGKDCYIHLEFSGNEPLRYGASDKTCEVVIKSTSKRSRSYLCSFIYNRQISFTDDLEKALVFESEEDAWNAIGRCWKDLKAVSYASQTKEANKPFLLLFRGGNSSLAGSYLQKRSSAHLWGTREPRYAMTFATLNAATRYAQELRDKGWGDSRIQQFIVVDNRDFSQTALAI